MKATAKKTKYPAYRNPVAASIFRAGIRRNVASLRTAAELNAWAGDNAPALIDGAARMVWMAIHAGLACGADPEGVDMRILRGMAESVGDLAQDGDIERHRPAIQSGLLAVERVLPLCSDWAIGLAAQELDRLLATTAGMGTADIQNLFVRKQGAHA